MPIEQLSTFRFHGAFEIQSEFGHVKLRHGTLEVLHRENPADTILRWRCVDTGSKSIAKVTDAPNWHIQNKLIWERFKDCEQRARDEVTFSIGRPQDAAAGDAQWLTFTDIIALDRFKYQEPHDPNPIVDMRIPCVTKDTAARGQNWFRVGRDQSSDKAAFVFAYQVTIPLPTGISERRDTNKVPWLALGGQHKANQEKSELAQSPTKVFSPPIDKYAIYEEFDGENRPRFGTFVIRTFKSKDAQSKDAQIALPEKLELGNRNLAINLGFLQKKKTKEQSPLKDDLSSHYEIKLEPHPEKDKLGIRVETRAQASASRIRHELQEVWLNLKAQLGRSLLAEGEGSKGGRVAILADFAVDASDTAKLQDQDVSFEAEASLCFEFQTDPSENYDPLGLHAANRWMEDERRGLLETRAQPQSFLPSFSILGSKKNVSVGARVALRGRMLKGEPLIDVDPIHGTIPPVAVTVIEDKYFDTNSVESMVALRTNFPATHIGEPAIGDGSASQHLYHLQLKEHPDAREQVPARSEFLFVIADDEKRVGGTHGDARHEQPLHAQLGSLELRGVKPKEGEGVRLFRKDDSGRLTLRPNPSQKKRHELEIRLPIALSDVQPVTSDLPHGVRDPLREDWLIPVKHQSEGSSSDVGFVLEVTEKLGPEQDHHLTANLFEDSAEGIRGLDDVLITRAPFGMMRLRRPPLADLGSEASANVATYDSDKRTWKFRSAESLVPISFPASTTGESMDKPGCRTIIDSTQEGEATASPIVRSRLSGPATLWVDTTEFGRNFGIPVHNARELFGHWGEAGPGTELAGFVTEFVYSLSTAWKRRRNFAALNSSVRVTETGTLMGLLIKLREDTGTEEAKELKERLPLLLKAISERPQHLETITRLDGRLTDYTPAFFSEGLNFVGRKTAVLAPPLRGITSKEDENRLGPKVADHGLDGGAFWAIEQRAFAQEVLDKPISTEGNVENFTVGPFGAGGMQVARFVNGSLAIITLSRLGRLEALRVEINGRIGAFHHRAKHVVVYRRTTAASDQFAGLGGTSERPILRKVEEFIDLQEPVRTYPDRANVDPRTTGPLRELRFGTQQINVDSAWADEVGTSGWRVPLWNRLAASERPVVYPKPSITAACQGEDTERLTLQELCDPGKLFFYTNVKFAKTESNTELWPAVHGVDGLDAADFDQWMRQQDTRAADGEIRVQRRPAASRFIPGAGAFTHCLTPSSALTKINEARGDRPVFAALESFTFMRGGGRNTNREKAAPEHVLGIPSKINDLLDNLEVKLPDLSSGSQPLLDLKQSMKDLANGIDRLIEEGKGDVKGAAQEEVKKLKDNLDAIGGQIINLPKAEIQKLEKAVFRKIYRDLETEIREHDQAYKLIKRIAKADEATCHALRQQALAAIRAKKMLVLQRLSGVQGQLLADLEADLSKDDLLIRLKKCEERAIAISNETVDRLDADVGNLAAQVADARALVRDWGADLDRAYRIGLERVASYRRSYERDKPWSPKRLDKAQQALAAQLANLKGEASAALAQARQRLASEISSTASSVTAIIDKSLRNARDELQSGSPVKKIAVVILTAEPEQFKALIDSVPTKTVGDIAAQLQDAINNKPLSDEQKTALKKIKAKFEALGKEVADLRADAEKLANERAKEIITKLTTLANEASAQVATLTADATGAVAQLEADLRAELTRVSVGLETAADKLRQVVENLDAPKIFDKMVAQADSWIRERAGEIHKHVRDAQIEADKWLGTVSGEITTAREGLTEGLKKALEKKVVGTVFHKVREALDELDDDLSEEDRERARQAIGAITDLLAENIDAIETVADEITDNIGALCGALVERKRALLKGLEGVKHWVAQRLEDYTTRLLKLKNATPRQLKEALAAEELGGVFEYLANGVEELVESALTAAVRAAEQAASDVARFGEELADNIARLVAAGGRIPDIGNLGINTDRVTAFFKDLANDIDVSRVFSSLGGGGDALGAFSFNMPVVSLGNGFDLPDLNGPNLNFSDPKLEDLLPCIAGINFKDIVPDFGRAGNSLKDLKKYVRITHDIDKKAKTAWAKAELDLPFPKRAKLFGFGPFTLFLKKPDLTAWVRIEANAKTKDVTTTEHGQIKTDMEAVIAGQPIVTLRDVLIVFTKDGGLDFDIDPTKIRLNPNFQFIQDILEGLGLDDGDNGLKLLKNEEGTPVGVEHNVAFPVPPVNAGTSGLMGLTIANTFQLKAYPDFFIRNQFNLSTREKPFVFSIFIIGGTGFVQLDVDHLPADNKTTILVTAGVGGSAALAFSFGPIAGGVFITLTVIMKYRKYIGHEDKDSSANEGLSISLELAIAGHVSLWGMATIYLRIALSISYHQSGQVDATGRLQATLRVSRFFKLRYSTTVRYRLRDGKSVTVRESSTTVEVPEKVRKAAKKLKQARARLA